MSKIILHLCGGTGINIGDKELSKISQFGEGFTPLEFNYLDTSLANISKIEPLGKFWQVTKLKLTDAQILGGGGERRTVFKDILEFIPKYIDEKGLHKRVTGEYHIVVFSASGASGGLIGTALIQKLLAIHIPTIAVVIGDSSNALYATNTLNTLASLNNIAIKAQKPLSVVYANNNAFRTGSTDGQGIQIVNDRLRNVIGGLSLFLSGENQELDQKDLEGYIDQSTYTTINVAPGLYGLTVNGCGEVTIPEGGVPTVARTLTLPDIPGTINGLDLLHHKIGYITNENAIKIFEKQVPLHLISYSNFFATESEALQSAVKRYQELEAKIKASNQLVTGTSNATEDESGFII